MTLKRELNIVLGRKRKLNLTSPFIIGSYDANVFCEEFARVSKATNDSTGAIITKSVTLRPQAGYPEPKTARFLGTILVASGMANPGVERVCNEIKRFKKTNPKSKLKIIGNIGFRPGSNFLEAKKEIAEIGLKFAQVAVDALEINLSCPHSNPEEKYKTEVIAQNPKLVFQTLHYLRNILKEKKFDTFIIAKVTGWNCDLVEACKAVKKADIDAVTISNMFPGTAYFAGFDAKILNSANKNYKFGDYLLGNKKGSFGGIHMFPAVLLMIESVYKHIDIPIIASGGCCTNISTVIQSFMAGAQAVSGVTPFYYDKNFPNSEKSISHLNVLRNQLEEFLNKKKISLEELVGCVLKNA